MPSILSSPRLAPSGSSNTFSEPQVVPFGGREGVRDRSHECLHFSAEANVCASSRDQRRRTVENQQKVLFTEDINCTYHDYVILMLVLVGICGPTLPVIRRMSDVEGLGYLKSSGKMVHQHYWVAFKELNLSYYIGENLLFVVIYTLIMVTYIL